MSSAPGNATFKLAAKPKILESKPPLGSISLSNEYY